MAMTIEHWNDFKLFISNKAQERGTQPDVQVELIREFWDSLQDAVQLRKTIEATELDQLVVGVPQIEDQLKKAKARKSELEKKIRPR